MNRPPRQVRNKVLYILITITIAIVVVIVLQLMESPLQVFNIGNMAGQAQDQTFTLYTEIPHGETTGLARNRINITYSATPSPGAYITSITYSINGREPRGIYKSRRDSTTRDVSLTRSGTIHFWPGENNIVFTITDSLGGQVTYAVDSVPYNTGGINIPPRQGYQPIASIPGGMISSTTLLVRSLNNIPFEEIERAVTIIDGRVIGLIGSRLFAIEVPASTENRLVERGNTLMQVYPHLFEDFSFNGISQTTYMPEASAWDDPGGIDIPSYRFRPREGDSWWGVNDWGVSRIRTNYTWYIYGDHIIEISVGVADTAFAYWHEDLGFSANIAQYNITNIPDEHFLPYIMRLGPTAAEEIEEFLTRILY